MQRSFSWLIIFCFVNFVFKRWLIWAFFKTFNTGINMQWLTKHNSLQSDKTEEVSLQTIQGLNLVKDGNVGQCFHLTISKCKIGKIVRIMMAPVLRGIWPDTWSYHAQVSVHLADKVTPRWVAGEFLVGKSVNHIWCAAVHDFGGKLSLNHFYLQHFNTNELRCSELNIFFKCEHSMIWMNFISLSFRKIQNLVVWVYH